MATHQPFLISGGRVIDPAQGMDAVADVFVADGGVQWGGPQGGGHPEIPSDVRTVDAAGLVVTPGFIDLHCHLREPGQEHKETIFTGTRAAAKGGFTTVCAMPNTVPALDNRSLIEHVARQAQVAGAVRVLPIGAITQGRQGKQLAEMYDMAEAGAIAFSDDGSPVSDPQVMRQALSYAKALGLPIIEHADTPELSSGSVMHEGWVSSRLGLPGAPAAAEEMAVAQDIALVRVSGGWLHVAHATTAGVVDLVRRAKAEGLRVTAEVTPHHLILTHEWLMGRRSPLGPDVQPYDTYAKVNPPLRTPEDCQALLDGLRDGTIDIIATDHAPHAREDKQVEMGSAAVGISGLETALGLLLTLVERGSIDLNTVVARLTSGPARLLPERYRGLGTLAPGSVADIAIFDPTATWMVDPAQFVSKGKNTPLAGCTLTGKVVAAVYEGGLVYHAEHVAAAVKGGQGV